MNSVVKIHRNVMEWRESKLSAATSHYRRKTYRAEDVAATDDLTLSEVSRSELPLLVQVQGRNIHSTKK